MVQATPLDLPPDPSPDPWKVLSWATDRFPRITLATSLGPQSIVVLHILEQLGRSVPAFLLDTGLLFDETLAFAREVEHRFGISIERVTPSLTVDEQVEKHGAALWHLRPDQCCHIRKVQPLQRHLAGADAWIAGLRRDQSASRAEVATVAWDDAHGLVKVNPLAFWSRDAVWRWIAKHNLPLHPLLRGGTYTSVGCRPCTRPHSDPQDERAGRWAFDESKTECGIHLSSTGVR